jgi:hypothetical protein
MNLILGAVCSCVALFALPCIGQSNTPAGTPVRFSLPSIRLRADLQAEIEKSAPAVPVSTPVALSTPAVALESSLSASEFHSRIIRSDEFYLTRAELPADSGVVRFLENTFTPEVVHIGKVPVTCSIITAIKRKNPLCLLNPLFFQVSW